MSSGVRSSNGSNNAANFLAVVCEIPSSASIRRSCESPFPTRWNSWGASILTSEKSKLRLAAANVISLVAETAEAVILPIDVILEMSTSRLETIQLNY